MEKPYMTIELTEEEVKFLTIITEYVSGDPWDSLRGASVSIIRKIYKNLDPDFRSKVNIFKKLGIQTSLSEYCIDRRYYFQNGNVDIYFNDVK